MQPSPILFSEMLSANGKIIAVAELNAPKSLNALRLPMIILLTEQLNIWQENDNVAVVVLKGAGGKAFCAGGDVVSLYHHLREYHLKEHHLKSKQSPISDDEIKQSKAYEFFHSEYKLDQLIHTYTKPILVWADGYVMGGGVGLMAGASHRVSTEKTLMAMPEVSIGLYPDVGASWFLNKMPNNIGLFLGLTGAMFNGADALQLDLADHLINSEQYKNIKEKLLTVAWQEISPDSKLNEKTNHHLLSDLLNEFAIETENQPKALIVGHQCIIGELTNYDNITDIYYAIVTAKFKDKELLLAQQKILNGSLLSIALIYRQLHRSKTYTLAQCFDSELNLSLRCCQQSEFSEGVRALLVDKDKKPKWQYKDINEIDNKIVEWFFHSLHIKHI